MIGCIINNAHIHMHIIRRRYMHTRMINLSIVTVTHTHSYTKVIPVDKTDRQTGRAIMLQHCMNGHMTLADTMLVTIINIIINS